ncbi:MAG: phosphodiester glycosidase family protein [Planctomycetota bacterium]|nr:phosphodiester glycosidase family protein [Planctomycetota bacterium]
MDHARASRRLRRGAMSLGLAALVAGAGFALARTQPGTPASPQNRQPEPFEHSPEVRAAEKPRAFAPAIEVRLLELSTEAGPVRAFVALVDLKAPGVRVVTTAPLPSGSAPEKADSLLIPTDEWARATGAMLAVNANFFGRVDGKPVDDSGKAREPSDIMGLSIHDGVTVSPAREFKGVGDPALLILGDGSARVGRWTAAKLPSARHAVAGIGASEAEPSRGGLLVSAGQNTGAGARVAWNRRHPRTAAGVSRDGRTLVLLVVDGRQPAWSVGMTLPELAELAIEQGAWDAINLDGGGSSAFVYSDGVRSISNRPSDGRFRPVANHLGIVRAQGSAGGAVKGSVPR